MINCLLLSLLLHPVHETTSEVEWNANTGRLEVALRLDSLDEQWLRKRRAKQTDDFGWALDYLRAKYRIAEPPKAGTENAGTEETGTEDSTRYRWIGREEDGAHVWWYFEIVPHDAREPKWIEVRVLFERENNYTHHVLRLDHKPRTALSLSPQRPRGQFRTRQESSGDRLSPRTNTGAATADR